MPFAEFDKAVNITDEQLTAMNKAAAAEGVKFNASEFERSKSYIRTQTKAFIARYIYQKSNKSGQNNEFYRVMNTADNTYVKAMTLFDRAQQLEFGPKSVGSNR